MLLTDKQIERAMPRGSRYKLSDGDGLALRIMPAGGKYWFFRFSWKHKDAELQIGVYPAITLKAARAAAREARERLAQGLDPRAERRASQASKLNTFREIAEEWLKVRSKPSGKKRNAPALSPATLAKKRWLLDTHLYPSPAPGKPGLEDLDCSQISSPQLLRTLKKIEEAGLHETAHRALSVAAAIFRYAIATGVATSNPAEALIDALAPVAVSHHAALIDPRRVGELLLDIESYHGERTTGIALELSPRLIVRPFELRFAEWENFNLKPANAAEWRIPGARMKMKSPHIVPLSRQAVLLLEELHALTGHQRYLFPSQQSADGVMSNKTLSKALTLLGYGGDVMTPHGFRSIASTFLNESGRWRPDAIERQLAHVERNSVRAAYNWAEYLHERRAMMQAYADYLDTLREEARTRGGAQSKWETSEWTSETTEAC